MQDSDFKFQFRFLTMAAPSAHVELVLDWLMYHGRWEAAAALHQDAHHEMDAKGRWIELGHAVRALCMTLFVCCPLP